ncbi:MAG: DUF6089 family protein [Clostridium sp.]|nr:DUF6089 family protein [Clostridium sp.]
MKTNLDIVRLIRPLMLATIFLASFRPGTSLVSAQQQQDTYKFSFGAALGMSGYLGDANQSNLYAHPGFAANANFSYLFADNRFAIRTTLATASLKGSTADYDNYIPGGEPIDFTSQVYDLGVRGEFNFFSFGIGETYKRLRRWTPVLGVGVGVTMASSEGKSHFGLNIPMSFGVRYKLSQRLNLEAIFTMTKTFSDHIDGDRLSDLYQIKSSFIKNTDWYSFLTVGITYEFGKRCVVCNRID